MSSTSETFDADELLHLALHANKKGETENAISLLKRSLNLNANDAKVIYMLGSLHAEIGMYGRAIQEMQQAVELDPELHTAQFQLGLLELTSGNTEKAKEAWTKLEKLEPAHYLRVFSDGLLLLIEDKLDDAMTMLKNGIVLNKENIPLNNDMANFVVEIERNKNQAPQLAQAESANENNDEDEGQRILSAYQSDFNN